MGHHDATGVAQPQDADFTVLVLKGGGYGLGAFQETPKAAEGFLEAQTLVHALLNEVGYNLGVSLGAELVSLPYQAPLQRQEILHNAVVDHGYLLSALRMGVGVGVGGPAVGGPAGVPQAHEAPGGAVYFRGMKQAVDLAHGLAEVQLP